MEEKNKQNSEKKLAAEKAVEFVKDGMIVGIGTGSTVFYAIKKLGELVQNGLNISAVSTSDSTTKLAGAEGIRLINLDKAVRPDINIDGADEADRNFNGIKGGGGALLFEKIVALSSVKNIWILDSSKNVEQLGKFPLPVEVIPFGYKRVLNIFKEMKYNPELRIKNNNPYLTDSGNYILDLHLEKIEDAGILDKEIKLITGVVETGLFINIADVIITGKNNSVEILRKEKL
ncbi:MAG: ribose-5-phosphate isomerase RpiA [Ignavibacteria bacterium]|nr:ribose-5-phosphate isomerase RpiA [Ignavibacteria bacterium]MBK8383406.1 ribose-5-phosphate isomerase RpiA [Ignavibacteria bacterium]